MRFKTSLLNKPKHTDLVSCVGWMSPDEVYSCGDDQQLLQWNLLSGETTKVSDLPKDVYPLDLHWLPKTAMQKSKVGSEVFLLTAADGKFYIVGRSGRTDKVVEAHRGAVLAGRWSHDGAGLVTAGEDGLVKIWSRSGMLRSTLAQVPVPVYGAAWAPDSDAVIYTSGYNLIIKPLAPNSKPIQWKAHDGVILKVAWNPNTGLILSGGEDTRYRVWDNFGRQLYSSSQHHHPITSLSWSPDGQLFAAGSFNTLRLCDKAGWCHSLEKPNTGSIFNLAWSSDGTQVAGACGNGHVIFAHVIENHLEWKNYEATVTSRKTIALRNVTNEAWEKLELRDRIIKVSLSHGHLVVVTSTQAYVYSTRNWNTPIILELKESNASLIVQSERHFLVVDGASVYIYSYDGRLLCSPRWPGMRTDVLNNRTVSLSDDTLAIRDKTDEKLVHLFDSTTGKALNDGKPWTHKTEIIEVALDKVGTAHERRMAVVDRNRDLFLVNIQRVGGMGRAVKLGGMVQSLCWNDGANMLAALQDAKFTVWFYPAVVFFDRDLQSSTISEKDATEYGKNAVVDSFLDTVVTVRRADGSLVTANVSPYPALLHNYVTAKHWDDAVRLARFVKDDTVWACLAAMATAYKELNTAEVAYAAINEVDKVQYIHYIKEIPIKEARMAEMALMGGHISDAESILLQSGLHFRAIMLNLTTYNFERALQLAIKHRTHVDTVIAFRQRYLARFNKNETSKIFQQYEKQVEVDWKKIQEKIELEFQTEREKPTSSK
ncbi:intraflagellar transport protein 80 homolog [Penaeus chinensis]|uniref:intraflagellar transport protein 80 homolog n=1 Tax=Penaeus chinensis TaxID=139456 RepID=UPI001FB6CA03|nr:intraflagellar transport protein 80 homolog [Penaeus chinensis]XP_047476922.1 intraflagellar transport protein 80 homolog [Penaeus chinensis]